MNAASPIPLPPKVFEFVAGDLSLDFCNTVGGKRGAVTREYLNGHLDLLSWVHQAGLVEDSALQTLARDAARNPGKASQLLGRAIELREALYRIFAAVSGGCHPKSSDLAILNSELTPALGRLRLEMAAPPTRFALRWANPQPALEHLLGPIARAAGDLLTQPERVERIRICGGLNCGWLFVDASKNHSRRWCDMRDCGNRAKVRRHRLKKAG